MHALMHATCRSPGENMCAQSVHKCVLPVAVHMIGPVPHSKELRTKLAEKSSVPSISVPRKPFHYYSISIFEL